MDQPREEDTDDSSILPVSSLRSRFENLLSANKTEQSPRPLPPKQPSSRFNATRSDGAWTRADGRFSLDTPRPQGATAPSPNLQPRHVSADKSQAAPDQRSSPRARPISMGPLSPPRSPPTLRVESPTSPAHRDQGRPMTPLNLPGRLNGESDRSKGGSPAPRQAPKPPPSRGTSPARNGQQASMPAPILKASTSQAPSIDPEKSSPLPAHTAPPINRAGKPQVPAKPSGVRQVSETLAPFAGHESADERVSPFSTPPNSDPSSPEPERASPPAIPEASKPRAQTNPSQRTYLMGAPAPPVSSRRPEPLPPPEIPAQPSRMTKPVQPGPTARAMPVRSATTEVPSRPPRTGSQAGSQRPAKEDAGPTLPARRSMDPGFGANSRVPDASHFAPPPKRVPSMPISMSEEEGVQPPKQPPRRSNDIKRVLNQDRTQQWNDDSDADTLVGSNLSDTASTLSQPIHSTKSEYPDAAEVNRRPPLLDRIHTVYDTKVFAVSGQYVCTTGYITRAWDITTGEEVLNMHHEDRNRGTERAKMTSAAFKPNADANKEGERIWLGSNFGEIIELDVPTGSIVKAKSAHKKEVVRIYRHASNMWSLDESGRVLIWPPDADGSPSLSLTAASFTVRPGQSVSVLTGNKLWIAVGRDLIVYQYDVKSESLAQATNKPLAQPGVGDVTAGSTIAGQSDRIYFGHVDGKITIYSVSDFTCLGVLNVSVYRINHLVGVGDYLWAAYNTGYIRVYDPRQTPWKVEKEWRAHPDRIHGVVLDRTSLWKMDRLHVVSLGTDQTIRFWDGTLRDDWLSQDMSTHDADFCDFREVSTLVYTWNAGASKPTWLVKGEATFFRDLLASYKQPPDILVFGFQELIDLEKKSTTAKNIFKLGKKKDREPTIDGQTQEHMSHQYRNWRDHLEREVSSAYGQTSYILLHTANLIGLFTCVFVKSSLRTQIRDVSGAEVKVGMGGHYGNKGALIVRFALDDSSLCFVNCHLAAGQGATSQRNNDIATIMEAHCLPAKADTNNNIEVDDMFVGGGDGSMILDHEVCILNGDLNYRIDAFTRDAVIGHVRAGNLAKLLERDQLLQSRRKNPGFRLAAFTEGAINFAPTYKYDVGTDVYDSSEKKRSPAWCDRLLYRGRSRIKQLEYRRHEIRVSDHRPVTGLFLVRVKTVDSGRRRKVWKEAEKRFETEKRRIAMCIKLDHLINVLGCSEQEAKQYLKK